MGKRHYSQSFRKFIWLETHSEEVEKSLAATLSQLPADRETLLISDLSLLNLKAIPSRQAHHFLGQDTERVIFNAFSGFNPNAFAQVCGTLRGGGELILLTPCRENWPVYADPEYQVFRGSRYQTHLFSGNFIRHLIAQLETFIPSEPPQTVTALNLPYLSDQQERLVQVLVNGLSRSGSTKVITADRGRGKTTSLGLALAEWVKAGAANVGNHLKVAITSVNREALEAFFSILIKMLPDAEYRGSALNHPRLSIRFYPAHVITEKCGRVDLIIVDEAAALPVTLLKRIQLQSTNHWYATTLHGYEGNGRGFELRFLAWLDRQKVSYQSVQMTEPVRWSKGDPLEVLSYRMLCLDAGVSESEPLDTETLCYEVISQTDLVGSRGLLQQLFGLLIAAHYRTTPNDLRQLLDSPDVSIRALMNGQALLAVAVLIEEGPLPPNLIEPIWRGYRRPSGDLIPQTLVSREGIEEAGHLKGWRVMRIAVHPSHQCSGLGSQLLTYIHQEAFTSGFDFCGASFAADKELLSFWLSNHYLPLRLGERSDRVTAGWPLLIINALSDKAKKVVEEVQRDFFQRLVLKLTLLEHQDEQWLVMRCLAALTAEVNLSEQILHRLEGVALHQRSIEDSLLSLRDGLSLPWIMRKILKLSVSDQQLLIGRVFKLCSSHELELMTGISGKRAQQSRIRQLLAELFFQ